MPSIGSSAKSLDSSLATAKHSSSSAASSGVTGMANAVCRQLLVMFRILGGDDGIIARADDSLSVTDRVLGVRGRLLAEPQAPRTPLDRRPDGQCQDARRSWRE